MKFEIQKDLTLKCSSNELTLDDVAALNRTTFIEDVPVTIHCNSIHQEALLTFFKFISNVKCLNVTIYVENLDYETARAIYTFAKKNPHTLKMKLDLGEKILAFISSSIMNAEDMQDIEDHLVSGIYSKLHTLVLESRYMSYVQASKLCKALLRTQLQAVELNCYTLDDETKDYFKSQLTQWLAIKNVQFFVQGRSELAPAVIAQTRVAQNKVSIDLAPSDSNCLEKALTWLWSKMSSHDEKTENELEPDDEDANRLMPSKPHLS